MKTPTCPVNAGLPCTGSACAWWDPEDRRVSDGSRVPLNPPRGRCGAAKGRNFPDPAHVPHVEEEPDLPRRHYVQKLPGEAFCGVADHPNISKTEIPANVTCGDCRAEMRLFRTLDSEPKQSFVRPGPAELGVVKIPDCTHPEHSAEGGCPCKAGRMEECGAGERCACWYDGIPF